MRDALFIKLGSGVLAAGAAFVGSGAETLTDAAHGVGKLPSFHIAFIYGAYGAMSSLVLPFNSARYRKVLPLCLAIGSGFFTAAIVGPAASVIWESAAIGVFAGCAAGVLLPAVIARPAAAFEMLARAAALWRGKK